MEPNEQLNDRCCIAAYFVILILLMLTFGIAVSLEGRTRQSMLAEGGWVETMTVVGYFLCALHIILKGGRQFLIRHHHLFLIVTLFGLRELDFDKRFTTMGILKSRFMTSPQVPVVEKIIGALVIALLVYVVARTIRLHVRDFIRSFRKLSAVTIGISLTGILLILTKSLDGIDRKLKGFGVEISGQFTRNTSAFEEVMELGVPLFLLTASIAYFRSSRPESPKPHGAA